MRLAELVATVYGELDPDAAMADLVAVAEHDRYQASAGIAAAAAEVAERAQRAGVREVTVHSFPADGARRWWTYRAPLGWTPLRARLRLDGDTVLRYPEQPYALAAYSAATPPGGRPARVLRWSALRSDAQAAGALVVVDAPGPAFPALAGRLARAGAVAVAADPLAARTDRGPDQVGRLELAPGSELAGFSVAPALLDRLAAAADAGATAEVELVAETGSGVLPVVTGVLPGSGPDAGAELLLTAHLCHPRPSANDNASGVAALLAAARVLAGVPGPSAGWPAVRFLWGPEFLGLAAYLHDVVLAGAAPSPLLAVNVDMAGQDTRRCGGPLVIERCPDDRPSFLPALAERCAALLPPAARSYSGAMPCDPWSWRSAPFAGGSDHALLVDPPTGRPAIGLGHWPDRTNHSSADTLDAVDPAELRRTATIAAATVAAVRGRADPALAADVADATACWAVEYALGALPGRRPPSPAAAPPRGEPVLDPRGEAGTAGWLAHRAGVALTAVRSLDGAGVPPERIRSLAGAVATALAALAPIGAPGGAAEPAGAAASPGGGLTDRSVLSPGWSGPVNLRALMEAAQPADRDWLDARLAEDRGGTYARAVALLRALDGRRDRYAAAWWAAYSSELAIPVGFAERLFDMLHRAGWAAAEPGGEGKP